MKYYELVILFSIIIFSGCSKENQNIRKLEGTWNIEYIEVYQPNLIDNTLEVIDIINDMGSVDFTNNKNNNKKDDDYPFTNRCVFKGSGIPPNSIINIAQYSDDIYWSIETTKRNNISRMQLMTAGGTNIFNYATYTIEWINDNEQLWYYYSSDNNGYDNVLIYQEVWKLKKNLI